MTTTSNRLALAGPAGLAVATDAAQAQGSGAQISGRLAAGATFLNQQVGGGSLRLLNDNLLTAWLRRYCGTDMADTSLHVTPIGLFGVNCFSGNDTRTDYSVTSRNAVPDVFDRDISLLPASAWVLSISLRRNFHRRTGLPRIHQQSLRHHVESQRVTPEGGLTQAFRSRAAYLP